MRFYMLKVLYYDRFWVTQPFAVFFALLYNLGVKQIPLVVLEIEILE